MKKVSFLWWVLLASLFSESTYSSCPKQLLNRLVEMYLYPVTQEIVRRLELSPKEHQSYDQARGDVIRSFEGRDVDAMIASERKFLLVLDVIVGKRKKNASQSPEQGRGRKDSIFHFARYLRLMQRARLLSLLAQYSREGLFPQSELESIVNEQFIDGKDWLSLKGVNCIETTRTIEGAVVSALQFIGGGAIEPILRAAKTLSAVPMTVYYSPHANLVAGANSIVTTESLIVSDEFVASLGSFDSDVWHELRHLFIRQLMGRGIPSPYHGQVIPNRPDIPLEIPIYRNGIGFDEISSFAFNILSSQSDYKKIAKGVPSNDELIELSRRVRHFASQGLEITNYLLEVVGQAGRLVIEIENEMVLKEVDRVEWHEVRLESKGVPFLESMATGERLRLIGPMIQGERTIHFYLGNPKGERAEFIWGLIEQNQMLLLIPIFTGDGPSQLGFIIREKARFLNGSKNRGVQRAFLKLIRPLERELGLRVRVFRQMKGEFELMLKASDMFLTLPSIENMEIFKKALMRFEPHPVRKID